MVNPLEFLALGVHPHKRERNYSAFTALVELRKVNDFRYQHLLKRDDDTVCLRTSGSR